MGYGTPDKRDGKRNRERKSKRIVTRWCWPNHERPVVVVEMTSQGLPVVSLTIPAWRVDDTSREAAAWWLNGILPKLSNDEAYDLIWKREGQ